VAEDIVERLRRAAVGMPQDNMNQTAADEIERLRAAGDDLAATLGAWARDDEHFVIAAWQEARRG
jgi:hypothetical protein